MLAYLSTMQWVKTGESAAHEHLREIKDFFAVHAVVSDCLTKVIGGYFLNEKSSEKITLRHIGLADCSDIVQQQ